MFKKVLLCGLVVYASFATLAAEAASVRGQVLDAGGEPADGATVALVELRRETVAGDDGRFEFADVRPGRYLVNVTSVLHGAAAVRVEVVEGEVTEITVHLDRMVHTGTVSVTATGTARGLFEVVQPVDVLGDDELVLRRQATLGETLKSQAGVSSTSYGQGASRPVVRGLGSDRVRVLENGLDSGDVSSIGPDHAVGTDPLAADRIEIVRGAGTLLYGPNALGGVINVIDGRVPDRVPQKPVSGTIELSGGTVADQKSGSFKLDGGGGRWAWHLDGFSRDASDYESPAPQFEEEEHEEHEGHEEEHEGEEEEHDHEEEMVTGRVDNSFSEGFGLTAGLSYVADRGYFGVAVSGFDTEYGVPGHHHHGEEHHEEDHSVSRQLFSTVAEEEDDDHGDEEVHTELEQRRVDVHGQIDDPFPGFRGFRLTAGWRDYSHEEIEGTELGTRFENDLTEVRLEGLLAPLGRFRGTLGVHWMDRSFSAIGEEAFVQPTDTERLGIFIYEESAAEPFGVQLGARLERQDTETIDPTLPDRDYTTWSAAAGVAYRPSDTWQISLNANRSERPPTAEELYSNGPHAATRAFEIGDPHLSSEVGLGAELTFRAETDRVKGWVSLYSTRFDDFIYLESTGEIDDDLEVFQFSQTDADFWGFELHLGHELVHRDPHHLHLEFTYDQVRAELRDSGQPLPRIPPRRALLSLVYLGDAIDARLEGVWVDEQDRVSEHESETPDYTMLNASISYKLFAGIVMHELVLRGTNLTDEAAYNHVSFLKTVAPLPGRDVSLIYRMLF